MNGPLNSLPNTGKTSATNTAATDWAAKLSAGNQANGSDAATLQSDFSRWMARASATTPQSQATVVQLAANAAKASGQAHVVQAKHQAPPPKSETAQPPKADKPKAQAASGQKPDNAQAKMDAAKGKPSEGADKAQDWGQASADSTPDDAKMTVAAGESVAKDSATAEAPTVSDPSSMLAWLAHLTQGSASAKSPTLGGDAQKSSVDASTLTGKEGALPTASATTGHDALTAAASASDQGAIDVSTLQAAEGRLAIVEGADTSAKGADFASTLSTEMMRGLAGKATSAQAAAPQASTLATPVNSPEFPQALADRVGMWVHAAGEDGTLSAELHLHPAEMGPISVKISLDGQSAQVDFAAANLETRRAIEASLPMLSASLDDAGFSLGGSGVSDQSPQQQFNQASGQPGGAQAWGGGGSGLDSPVGEQEGRVAKAVQAGQRGGLDLYA